MKKKKKREYRVERGGMEKRRPREERREGERDRRGTERG